MSLFRFLPFSFGFLGGGSTDYCSCSFFQCHLSLDLEREDASERPRRSTSSKVSCATTSVHKTCVPPPPPLSITFHFPVFIDMVAYIQPREALLKYATASVEDNEWTSAWTKTQPKPVFDLRPAPEDEEKDKKK